LSGEQKKTFDVKQLIGRIHTVYDQELGEIRFGDLTLADAIEINSLENLSVQDKSLLMIGKMLQKADPDFKPEYLKALPVTVASKLIRVMNEHSGFLSAPASSPQKSLTGSKETRQRKQSA
jgi:hypothetical protein